MWQDIIKKLLAEGRSEKDLARDAGCTQPTINRLRNGKTVQPTWLVGQRLMQLAGQQCQCAVHDHQEAA